MLKKKGPLIAIAAALLVFTSASRAADDTRPMHADSIDHQIEIAHTPNEHEGIARYFENEASELEMKAGEHERLLARYRGGVGGEPQANRAKLADHCKHLVVSLRASAQEAREMARLHRAIAQQLAK